MKFPFEKYRYSTFDIGCGVKKTIAESSFHGHKVRGYSICSKEDEFNSETGEKLAALRCNVKILGKKCKYSKKKIECYEEVLKVYSKKLEEEKKYYNENCMELAVGLEELYDFESNLK